MLAVKIVLSLFTAAYWLFGEASDIVNDSALGVADGGKGYGANRAIAGRDVSGDWNAVKMDDTLGRDAPALIARDICPALPKMCIDEATIRGTATVLTYICPATPTPAAAPAPTSNPGQPAFTGNTLSTPERTLPMSRATRKSTKYVTVTVYTTVTPSPHGPAPTVPAEPVSVEPVAVAPSSSTDDYTSTTRTTVVTTIYITLKPKPAATSAQGTLVSSSSSTADPQSSTSVSSVLPSTPCTSKTAPASSTSVQSSLTSESASSETTLTSSTSVQSTHESEIASSKTATTSSDISASSSKAEFSYTIIPITTATTSRSRRPKFSSSTSTSCSSTGTGVTPSQSGTAASGSGAHALPTAGALNGSYVINRQVLAARNGTLFDQGQGNSGEKLGVGEVLGLMMGMVAIMCLL